MVERLEVVLGASFIATSSDVHTAYEAESLNLAIAVAGADQSGGVPGQGSLL